MKVIILVLILLTGLVTSAGLIFFMPYHTYQTYLESGLEGRIIKVKRPKKFLLHTKKVVEYKPQRLDTDALWKDINFSNTRLPMPISHPNYRVIPNPVKMNKVIKTNIDYINENNQSLLTFSPLKTIKANLSLPPDLLFSIPLVKKYIYKKGRPQIWKDVFNKELDTKFSVFKGIFNPKKLLKTHPPLELAYNIYIYKLRLRLFPKRVKKVEIINDLHFFFYKNIPKDAPYVSEGEGRFLLNGKLYRYNIREYVKSSSVDLLKSRIFSRIRFSPDRGIDSAYKIYSEFKQLKYNQKISFDGMAYLYFAWTHDIENKGFYREMIQHLEKNKKGDVKKHLFKLYSFARKNWGSNFSSLEKFLKEDEMIKLRRKIELEKQAEEDKLKNLEVDGISEENKVEIENYLLDKGREKKTKKKKGLIEN